jgi:hypothetical protein
MLPGRQASPRCPRTAKTHCSKRASISPLLDCVLRFRLVIGAKEDAIEQADDPGKPRETIGQINGRALVGGAFMARLSSMSGGPESSATAFSRASTICALHWQECDEVAATLLLRAADRGGDRGIHARGVNADWRKSASEIKHPTPPIND